MTVPDLRLLNSDRVTVFDSFSFGNVISGNISSPKLLFAEASGVGDCENSEFGIAAISGNNGYLYAEVSPGLALDLTGITLAAQVLTSGGAIASTANLSYKIAAVDAFDFETAVAANIVTPVFVSGLSNRVVLTWEEVVGALLYRIYSSISGGAYFLVGETSSLTYTDTTGTNDGVTEPQIIGSQGYRFATWGSTTLNLDTIVEGEKIPVGIRINLSSLPSAAGNPQTFSTFVSFASIESS